MKRTRNFLRVFIILVVLGIPSCPWGDDGPIKNLIYAQETEGAPIEETTGEEPSIGQEDAGAASSTASFSEEIEDEVPPAVEEALKKAKLGGLNEETYFDEKKFTGSYDEAKPGTYDASEDVTNTYNFPKIAKDVPKMVSSYGPMFEKIGAEMGVDPAVLATYAVFESYHSGKHNYNPGMKDDKRDKKGRGMYAAGIGATQAQIVKGQQIPGLPGKYYPPTTDRAADFLRKNPEYSIRSLAKEFQEKSKNTKDLATIFPKVAYPAWGKPTQNRGNYGNLYEYQSRCFFLYKTFKAEFDKKAR